MLDDAVPSGTGVSATTTGTTVVLVMGLVVVVVVVLLTWGVVVGAGSSAGAGFCHTDWVVGARLGNKLSRIANAAPTDPSNTTAATTATDQAPFIDSLRPP